MKKTTRILSSLLVAVILLLSMNILTASAADTGVMVFLTPNSNWRADNARFAIYTWDGGERWFDMTDSNGDGVYECLLPKEVSNVIFCRMTPSDTANNWDNKWNQTEDLIVPANGDNHYKVKSGTWDKGGGEWSYFDHNTCVHSPKDSGAVTSKPTCIDRGSISHICSKCGEAYTEDIDPMGHAYGTDNKCIVCGKIAVYIIAGNVMKSNGAYAEGDNSTFFGSEWDVSDEYNMMEYDTESECFVKIYEGVAKGEYHFKVAEDMSWDVSYGHDGGNCYVKVEENNSIVVITLKDGNVTVATMAGSFDGVEDDNSQKPDAPTDSDKTDTDNENNQPEEELNFFQKIWKAIVDFFKRLFGIK